VIRLREYGFSETDSISAASNVRDGLKTPQGLTSVRRDRRELQRGNHSASCGNQPPRSESSREIGKRPRWVCLMPGEAHASIYQIQATDN